MSKVSITLLIASSLSPVAFAADQAQCDLPQRLSDLAYDAVVAAVGAKKDDAARDAARAFWHIRVPNECPKRREQMKNLSATGLDAVTVGASACPKLSVPIAAPYRLVESDIQFRRYLVPDRIQVHDRFYKLETTPDKSATLVPRSSVAEFLANPGAKKLKGFEIDRTDLSKWVQSSSTGGGQ